MSKTPPPDAPRGHWLTTGTVAEPVEVRRFSHTNSAALTEAQRLRADAYLRHGLLDPSELVDGVDACPDDARAVHVGMYAHDGQLVGTVRVIRGLPCRPIPVARAPYHVRPDDRPHGEISRYVVAEGWNGLGLVAGAWRELVRICIDERLLDLYAQVEGFLLDTLLAAGLPFQAVGEPRFVYNATNHPVRLRMDSLVADLLPRNPMLAAFLADGWRPRGPTIHPSELMLTKAELLDFNDWWADQTRQDGTTVDHSVAGIR